jgi:hypothetical protein
MPMLSDPMKPASLKLVFIDICNKPSRLRR